MEDFSRNIADAFLRPHEKDELAKVIEEAEKRTKGEIVVSIVGKASKPNRWFRRKPVEQQVHEFAVKHFMNLGIQQTEGATGVLVLIAVQERQIEVIADKAVNIKVPQTYWKNTIKVISEYIKKGDPCAGIKLAIIDIGKTLETIFPRANEDKNELPNAIMVE